MMCAIGIVLVLFGVAGVASPLIDSNATKMVFWDWVFACTILVGVLLIFASLITIIWRVMP